MLAAPLLALHIPCRKTQQENEHLFTAPSIRGRPGPSATTQSDRCGKGHQNTRSDHSCLIPTQVFAAPTENTKQFRVGAIWIGVPMIYPCDLVSPGLK